MEEVEAEKKKFHFIEIDNWRAVFFVVSGRISGRHPLKLKKKKTYSPLVNNERPYVYQTLLAVICART